MFFYLLFGILSIIAFLYLLAIMPKMFNTHKMTEFQGYYYAHRGLHHNPDIAPENSMAAFKLAVDNSYGIELDVQLSKDNIPIVFHDASLKRVCGIDKKVRDLTFNELRELNLFNSEEKIPHFKEVLDLVNGQIPLIVELKLESKDTTICSIVASVLDEYKGVYCIESFNPIVLLWYKRHRPKVIRGQLSSNFFKEGKKNKILNFILQNLLLNFATKPDFIAFNHKYRNMLSYTLCHRLFKTNTVAYTIKSHKELEDSWDSFDLFIFDNFIPAKTL